MKYADLSVKRRRRILAPTLVVAMSGMAIESGPGVVAVEGGTAGLRAATNIAGIEVSGSSKAVSAQADIEMAVKE